MAGRRSVIASTFCRRVARAHAPNQGNMSRKALGSSLLTYFPRGMYRRPWGLERSMIPVRFAVFACLLVALVARAPAQAGFACDALCRRGPRARASARGERRVARAGCFRARHGGLRRRRSRPCARPQHGADTQRARVRRARVHGSRRGGRDRQRHARRRHQDACRRRKCECRHVRGRALGRGRRKLRFRGAQARDRRHPRRAQPRRRGRGALSRRRAHGDQSAILEPDARVARRGGSGPRVAHGAAHLREGALAARRRRARAQREPLRHRLAAQPRAAGQLRGTPRDLPRGPRRPAAATRTRRSRT